MRNSVTLIGRPGAEPEMRNLNNQNKVARFRLAVTESRRNANREWVNDTQWFNVVAWGAQADHVLKNVKKGLRVAVNGTLRNNDWTDDKGQRHSSVEVWVSDLLPIDRAKE